MIVVDSDLICGWIYQSSSPYNGDGHLLGFDFQDIARQHGRPLVPFVCVPDIFAAHRYQAGKIEDPRERQDFLTTSEPVLQQWLSSYLEIVYPTQTNARSWTQMACDPRLPEEATNAHVWVAVIVHALRARYPDQVVLGALETRVYKHMIRGGFLPPDILESGIH